MKTILVPLNLKSKPEIRKLVKFVNASYRAAQPLTDRKVAAGATQFFWAYEKKSGDLLGVTAYVERTPCLVETVKTIVAPEFRGKGIGALLSRAIEAEVRKRGYTKVMTTIYTHNIPMIVIKLKQGYRFEGFHPNHEKPGFDEYSFGKELRKGRSSAASRRQ